MNISKKGFVGVLVIVVLILLYNFGGNITGDVFVEPMTCDESEILKVWSEIFVEDSEGARIYSDDDLSGDGCAGYIAIKNDSDGGWLLSGGRKLDSGGVKKRIGGTWVNLTDAGLEIWANVNSYDNQITFEDILGSDADEYIENWTGLSSFFSDYVKVEVGSWVDDDESWVYFEDNIISNNITEDLYGIVGKVSSFVFYDIERNEGFPLFLGDNVSNLLFEMNSSWNLGPDLDDYFSNVDIFGIRTVNRSGGTVSICDGCVFNINYSIDSDNKVSFMPVTGWTGTETFQMSGHNVEGEGDFSNDFNVTIVEHINNAPVLRRNFENIDVIRGGSTIVYLDVYFEDPDGDNLTYSVSGDENLDIDISDDVMTIQLGDNFTDFVKIRIYASDGLEETKSNSIYVYDLLNSSSEASVSNVTNETSGVNESVDNETTSGGVDNRSLSSVGEDEDDNGINWVLWIIIIIIGLVVVFVVLWFFVFRKRGGSIGGGSGGSGPTGSPGVPGSSASQKSGVGNIDSVNVPVSPVNSYLNSLNLSK